MKTNYNKMAEETKEQQGTNNPELTENKIETPVKPQVDKPETTSAIVFNCERLNIRKKPSPNAQVECVVNKDTKLTIGKTSNGWTEVYNKKGTEIEGYVMEQYIKEV